MHLKITKYLESNFLKKRSQRYVHVYRIDLYFSAAEFDDIADHWDTDNYYDLNW